MLVEQHPHHPQPAEQSMDLPCRLLLDLKTELGEGLLWDSERGHLLMTDILKGQLLEIDIDTGSRQTWAFDEPLAWVLKTDQPGAYVLGLGSGIAGFDIHRSERLHWINREFPGHPKQRLNDACVDAWGGIWLGSMNSADPWAKDGQLASFRLKDGLRLHDRSFTVTNGPVVSADGQYLFLNDTLRGTVYRYRVSERRDMLTERQVFAQFDSAQGYPDGMCFDAHGYLWVALWGGASIVQLDPMGRVLRQVSVPAKNVTNVCFCGPGLDRLVVSSAAIDMSDADHQQYPCAGALFEVFNHGCVGLPTHCVNVDSPWT